MKIRVGYSIAHDCPQPTPMILALSVHPSRAGDLLAPERLQVVPEVPIREYEDGFGNRCHFLEAPAGRIEMTSEAIVEDSGLPDEYAPEAVQHPVAELPTEVLVYLLGSRYCETDRLNNIAWSLFGNVPKGWGLVQAICDFVHQRITFGYQHARATKSAWDAYHEQQGVCRDFAHLAVTLCRCMNIPARYCTGYLGDHGVPPDPAPMDFSAWFEVYLGGRWYTFDARHNTPRIGRVLMARGRDATDVAMVTSFGPCTLSRFEVIAEEVAETDLARVA